MGAQKQLLPFGDTTVIGHVVGQLLHSKLHEIYVVVGHEGDRIAAELSGRLVRVVTNPQYHEGMLSSVRCGLRALPSACEAVLVVLGDQPAITASLVDAMRDAFVTAGRGIIVPGHGGQRGHPLLLAARYVQEILTCYGDVGLCGLLQAHADDLFELAAPTAAVLCDMDDPEAYRRELARFERGTEGPNDVRMKDEG
jgi:molybdenum cofactor cytidylyltransferase